MGTAKKKQNTEIEGKVNEFWIKLKHNKTIETIKIETDNPFDEDTTNINETNNNTQTHNKNNITNTTEQVNNKTKNIFIKNKPLRSENTYNKINPYNKKDPELTTINDASTTVQKALDVTYKYGSGGIDKIKKYHLEETESHTILANLYQVWLNAQHIPSFVKIGVIASLEKIVNPTEPKYYRPITLLPMIYKIFERIIWWKLIDHKVENNLNILQGGFRVKRGVLEQLGALRVLSETAIKERKPLYVASLDIRKAYDMVWRPAIVYKLHKHYKVPLEICKIIQTMLENTRSGVKNEHDIEYIFDTINGVVQGGITSPLLYGVFMNDLLEELVKSGLGFQVNKKTIPGLAYCDDIVLTANTKEELYKLLTICEKHSKTWKYEFNADKCKVMAFNDPENISINYNEQTIKNIQYEYNSLLPKGKIHLKTAPLLIQNIENNIYKGIDIRGKKCEWKTIDFPKKYREKTKQFIQKQKHLNIKQPYPILYDAIAKYCADSAILSLQTDNNCKVNDKNLQYSPAIRYLGAILHAQDPNCIISSYHTTQTFKKKMQTKENTLFRNYKRYTNLPLEKNINLTKAMFEAYTEVFGQIMPLDHMKIIDDYCFESLKRLIPIKSNDPSQYHTYLGIPMPTQMDILKTNVL